MKLSVLLNDFLNIKRIAREIDNVFLFFQETMEHKREQADCLRNGRRANLRDLLRTPNMRMKTLIISLSWLAIFLFCLHSVQANSV